ncbi:Brain-specific angiogenesis inhibitor 1 [Orchesella cincta]|uniref:Brain-specific angiogenesis inhibitor 1 n=1 Tax=Orchesella cincta TaxID=48709 RepID=A0A1D2NMZ3_ORCCI|nr:Brain-specific angiogenesis inhibitor 1 [Orchesella cincta]
MEFNGASFWLLVSIFQFLIYCKVQCLAPPPDKYVKFVLYHKEDKKGVYMRYYHFPQKFINIPNIYEERGIESAALACCDGAWLVYEETDYSAPTLDKVVLFADTIANCKPAADFKTFGSIQHITPLSDREKATITFFSDTNFNGPAMRFNGFLKAPSTKPTASDAVGSFITVNTVPWTVMLTDGERYCITPPADGNPVCFMSNFVDNILVKPHGGVLRVRKGCAKDLAQTVITMTECYDIASGVNPINPAWPSGKPEVVGGNNTGGGCEIDPAKEVLDETLKPLIEARLNGSLGSGDMLTAVKDKRNIWKMELFDRVYELFVSACPAPIVSLDYMQVFAALFVHHLNNAWEDSKFLNNSIREEDWMTMVRDLRECRSAFHPGSAGAIAVMTSVDTQTYRKLDDLKDKVEKLIGFSPQNDHVMEINWLMANLVACVCHKANGYDVNFYPRFFNMYHELLFLPIMEQWKNPGKYPEAYKYLFGGYGMDKVLTKITLCTQNYMLSSGISEIYPRPMEQKDTILLPTAIER